MLTGGGGQDILTGGAGADRFDYNAVADSATGGGTRDTITDFNHLQGDRIDLASIDWDTVTGGDQAFSFIGSAAFSAAGQVRYASGVIEVNTTGAGVAEMEIAVTGSPTLVAADFFL